MKSEELKNLFETDLHFYWQAHYKNGEVLSQVYVNDKNKLVENSYTEIFQHPERFKKFELVNVNDGLIRYSVDLETGDFNLKGIKIKNNIDLAGNQIKCIYWRNKSYTLNMANMGRKVRFNHYILGWQVNITNQNIKREYKIFPDFSVEECFNKNNQKILTKSYIKK